LDSQRIATFEGRSASIVSGNDQFRDLIEAYAIGLLDAAERVEVEAHLASGCAECVKSLEEARWLVSQLAYLAPNAEPSDMLKGRLLQTVRGEAASGATPASVRRTAVPWSLWAGVVALLIFSVLSARNEHRLRQAVVDLQHQANVQQAERERLEAELGEAKTQAHEAMIWSDPKSVKIMLRPKDPNMPQLEAMWHPEMGLVVRGWKVPSPGDKRMLQLWLIPKKAGGKPMPATTFWPDATGKFTAMVENPPDAMSDTQALAITEEPMGGSPQPTSAPMWIGGVS
jgi:anti-sigma-K factor RskA